MQPLSLSVVAKMVNMMTVIMMNKLYIYLKGIHNVGEVSEVNVRCKLRCQMFKNPGLLSRGQAGLGHPLWSQTTPS